MKLLNIGAPFYGLSGGDKQRGMFEWEVLSKSFEVQNLLVTQGHVAQGLLESHKDLGPASALTGHSGKHFRPASIYDFDRAAQEKYVGMLNCERYDVIFIRHLASSRLARLTANVMPDAKIIIDADILNSRIANQAWRQNRSISNRFFLLESCKMKFYEKILFNQPYLILMSNPQELDYVRSHYVDAKSQSQFAVIPNVMPDADKNSSALFDGFESNYILFHGIMTSSVNIDAFRFLIEDIYPLLHSCLERSNVVIRVVGRGLSDFHRSLVASHNCVHVELVGEVDDIGEQVHHAILCLIPLRMGSGTKTRVLEAAAFKKCVVTTSLGVEGLELGEREIVICDRPEEIAQALGVLLEDRARITDLATKLFDKCSSLYTKEVVGSRLANAIQYYEKRKKNSL